MSILTNSEKKDTLKAFNKISKIIPNFYFSREDIDILKVVFHTIFMPIILTIATHNILNAIAYQAILGFIYSKKYEKNYIARVVFGKIIEFEFAFILTILFIIVVG